MRKRQLAVSDSDSSHEGRRDTPHKSRLSKVKGKSGKRDEDTTTDEDEVESFLIDNSQAGLKIKSSLNGKKKQKKQKEKEKERENKKSKAKTNEKGKGKALAIDDESEDSDANDGQDAGSFQVTESEGSLHGSDDEPGLGKWTEEDQRKWQDPKDEDGEYIVDIIIRWRWHPQYHFAQYRVRWEGYSERDNTWEPIESFNGDDVDNFWKDREFDGAEQRPRGWDEEKEDVLKRLEAKGSFNENEYYNTDTDIYSADSAIRKVARRKARRAIRMDRVEMKEAYRRRMKRDRAEAEIVRQKEEKIAEERRRRRREEEKAAKEKALATAPRKTVISHGLKITQAGTSKPSVVKTAQPAPREATSSTSISKSAAAPSLSTSKTPLNDVMEFAKKFLPASDAKLKADRKKARLDDGRPIPAANPSVIKPQTLSTPTVDQAKIVQEKANETSPRSGNSTAVRGGGPTTRGAYRGAHKDRRRTIPWNPFATLDRPATSARPNNNGVQAPPLASISAPLPFRTSTVDVPATEPKEEPPSEAHSGWDYDDDDEPGAILDQESAPIAEPVHPMQQAQRLSVPTPSSIQALPQPHFARGVLMGRDPRNRSMQQQQPVVSTSARIPGSVSPFGPPTLESPNHPLQSPIHPNQSPREGQPSGLMSPLADQATSSDQRSSNLSMTPAERERAKQVISRWRMDKSIQIRISRSYNLLAARLPSNRDQRRLLESAIRYLQGGVVMTFEAKHKEAHRNSIVWVPSSDVALTSNETEALKYENFAFFCYENESVQEIWPFSKGKVIMYTFGALIIKLVEQLFVKKEIRAWTEAEGTSILVHPWQKAVMQQLIDLELVEEYLGQILGIVDNVPDKGFELVVSAIAILDEIEEVPHELTNTFRQSTDVPTAGDGELEKLNHVLDMEVSQTLHRLQSEWRTERRSFTLVMAKTRLVCRELPTSYLIL